MGFAQPVMDSVDRIVEASLTLYDDVSKKFLPSAAKFTYNWSLRELTNVFQGICLMRNSDYSTVSDVVRIWVHEFARVISDRFFTTPEVETYVGMMRDVMKKQFPNINQEEFFKSALIYTAFANSNTGAYLPVDSMEQLKKVVDTKLIEYNESNAMMDLVLFEAASEHICRIARIISQPSGNAMLIGVGGSGKQSLSRLAAFINGMEVRQLQVTGTFKVDDLLEAFREMFKQAGVKGIPIMFLMTDTQVIDDRFLIYINAVLASGWISGLFAKDEIDGMLGNLNNEAKAAGIPDMPEARIAFLISRIRNFFHVVLCFR
jgi:dynein heavy chain